MIIFRFEKYWIKVHTSQNNGIFKNIIGFSSFNDCMNSVFKEQIMQMIGALLIKFDIQ